MSTQLPVLYDEAILRSSQLPLIDRPIDNTAMQAYMACPREFFISMILHRRGEGRTPPLVFGSGWHVALETHYKTGGDRIKVITETARRWEGHGISDDYRTLARVHLDYDAYRRKFSLEEDFKATVGWPDSPIVEIATNAQGSALIHPWAGKIDRPVVEAGMIYAEDHKTTSRFDKHYWKQYELSMQMMGYTYLLQQLMPGERVVGARINLSHCLTNKTEFHRMPFTYTSGQIREWCFIVNTWMARIQRDMETYNEALHAGMSSWEALNVSFPAHFGDNGCSRKFGMCGYYEVCSIDQKIRERKLLTDFPVNPWNPLAADEESV